MIETSEVWKTVVELNDQFVRDAKAFGTDEYVKSYVRKSWETVEELFYPDSLAYRVWKILNSIWNG